MQNYEPLMQRTIQLAKNGAGSVSPNPLVGAIITRNGEIISEGWHKKYGEIHAEIDAINKSNINDFSDCDLIVNLEPCSHEGHQPPCVDEIIKRKFRSVIIGMKDPNPLVNGLGIKKLIENGINVIENVCEEDCKCLNKIFIKNITSELPFVIVKIASTLDGYISSGLKKQEIITCEKSLKDVHKMRSEVDAVLVGKGTILNDNPLLNVRLVDGRNPKRIILDTNLELPLEQNIYLESNRDLNYVVVNKKSYNNRKANILKMSEVNIVEIDGNESDKIELKDILSILFKKFNIASILVEGGAKVFKSFIDSDLMDELILYQAPKLLGHGIKYYENQSINNINNALKMKYINSEMLGCDIKITLRKEISI